MKKNKTANLFWTLRITSFKLTSPTEKSFD